MERQLYYNLINAELTDDYPALLERTTQYLREKITENSGIVQYFKYSGEALDQFLLRDCQATQEKYAKYIAENPPPRSREDMITYLTQLTPAKYVDGAWVQGAAKAYNTALEGDSLHSKVVNILFNIYAEELGEGVLEMNHIAIWKSLLANLSIEMPDPASHAFAFNPNLWDSSFTVGVIQLALGTLTSSFFPEVLGYNMGFEQLPLHLLTTVDEMRKLEMDPYYFQLHISIDNLASGHGRMATEAVKIYLDGIKMKFGEAVAETHWRRILDGFYLNEISPMKPVLEEYYAKRHAGSLEDKIVKMFRQKAPFAHQLHGTREVAGCPLNKWLDPAGTEEHMRNFLEALSASHWVNTDNPANSKFLTDLCGFGGPMFHIFTRDEQQVISDWLHSLCPVTPISPPPVAHKSHQITNAQGTHISQTTDDQEIAHAMADLMVGKAERAKRAHGNRTMANAQGDSRKINDWFSNGTPWEILDALRHTYHLDMVASSRGDMSPEAAVDANPFVKSITKGGMAKYFDQDEVAIVRKWILSGAPILSAPLSNNTQPITPTNNTLKQSGSRIPPANTQNHSTSSSAPISIDIDSPTPIKSRVEKENASMKCPFVAKSKPLHVPSDSQDLFFFKLVNVEAHPEAFAQAKAFLSSRFVDYSLNAPNTQPLDSRNEPSMLALSSMIFSCDSMPSLTQLVKHASLFFFTEGICLQNVNMAGFHHTYTSSILVKIFMNIWGYEQPLANHHHFFNNLLQLLRVYLPPLNSSFISKCGFKDSATEFAILQLSLSLFPRTFYLEMLTVLEWNLVMNKTILEDVARRIQNFGAFALDYKAVKARLEEYTNNITMCREVIQLQMDDARAQGAMADYNVRVSKTRHLCRQLTNEFLREIDPDLPQKACSQRKREEKPIKLTDESVSQPVGMGSA